MFYYISQIVPGVWLVNFAGRIPLYSPLITSISFLSLAPDQPQRYNKYIINLVFSVRTVRYGSSFFSPRPKREARGPHTLLQNGFHFNILLFSFKLALLASFVLKYSFEFWAQERGKKG